MKIHMVKKGDTLYELSKKYGIELEKLMEMNPQIENPDKIDVGTKIKIPSATQPVTAPAYEIVHKHVVRQGDTLWQLSKHWNVPLEAMIKANKQLKNPNALLTGEVVNIPMMQGNAPVEKAKLTAPMEKVSLTAPMEEVHAKPSVTEAIVTMPTFEAEIKYEYPYAMPLMPVAESPELVKVPVEEQPSHGLFKQFEIPAKEAMSFYDMPVVAEMHPSFDLTKWPQFPGQPVATETMPVEHQMSYVTETSHPPMHPYEAAWPTYPNVAAPQTYHYPTGDCGCQGSIPQLALPYSYSAGPQPILHSYMGWQQTGVSPYAVQTPEITMPGTGYGIPDGAVPETRYGTFDGTVSGIGYGTTSGAASAGVYGTVPVTTAYGIPYGTMPAVGYESSLGTVPGVYGMPYGTGYEIPYGLPYGSEPEAAYPSVYSERYPDVGPYGMLNEMPLVSTHEHKRGDFGYGGKAAADSLRNEAKEQDKKTGNKRTAKSGSSKKTKSGDSKAKVSAAERKTHQSQETKSYNLPWINL